MTDAEFNQTAERLKRKVGFYRAAHFRASDHLRIWHYVLGFLLIVLSAGVAGSVLQATEGDPSQALTLTAGALSVAVVALTSIQTTFKLGERGELHRSAAAGFGRIGRRLDVFIHRPHPDIAAAWEELLAIADEIGNVEAGAPGFLRQTYDGARDELLREMGSGTG